MLQIDISIHAPVKGATQGIPGAKGADGHFNPRPREGSDLLKALAISAKFYFNPRPREGSDCIMSSLAWMSVNFNPRPREGSDQPTAH